MKLSIVIPCYNEEKTITAIIDAIHRTAYPEKELIVVDDCSTDSTKALLQDLKLRGKIDALFEHAYNRGKGAALRTGMQNISGDIVIIQDADLEYDPHDYEKLIQPILDGHADVVYGSRFLSGGPHRVLYFWHRVANALLTFLSNCFTNLNLTDMETCYKAFRTEVIQSIHLEEDRFGIEPEITAKIARKKCRVYEVGISYHGRRYEEGKKIGWKDGVRAVYCIFKYGLFR